MRILVDIGHPAHVHFYKHAIQNWKADGHNVLITVRPKKLVTQLLDAYSLDYQVLMDISKTRAGLLREFVVREIKLMRVMHQYKPDVITAVGGMFIAPAAKILGIPSVVFTDSEHVKLDRFLTYPLASSVITPAWFIQSAGPNHHLYNGFQEGAYLDPEIFIPDPAVLSEAGISPQDRFALVRFIAWNAGHDAGQSGFTNSQKIRLVKDLEKLMSVLVSAEGNIPEELKSYQYRLRPENVHDILYYASLYVGEGATMATEAALLGTPAVFVSSLVGTMGNFRELENKGLLQAASSGDEGYKSALEFARKAVPERAKQDRIRKLFQEYDNVSELVTDKVLAQADIN